MTIGALIVIEGTDGSGKNTQTKLLVDRLNKESIQARHMSFPRYDTPTGRIIGQCYLGKNIGQGDSAWLGDPDKVDPLVSSLYYAADRRAAAPEMREILASGTNLILDRYYQSNMAHQGGKIKDLDERRAFFEALGMIELQSLGIPREDKVIFLYMPWEVSLELMEKRGGTDGHEANPEHLKRAEAIYMEIASTSSTWKRVDCAPDASISSLRTPEDIAAEVYGIAMETIEWKSGKGGY